MHMEERVPWTWSRSNFTIPDKETDGADGFHGEIPPIRADTLSVSAYQMACVCSL